MVVWLSGWILSRGVNPEGIVLGMWLNHQKAASCKRKSLVLRIPATGSNPQGPHQNQTTHIKRITITITVSGTCSRHNEGTRLQHLTFQRRWGWKFLSAGGQGWPSVPITSSVPTDCLLFNFVDAPTCSPDSHVFCLPSVARSRIALPT